MGAGRKTTTHHLKEKGATSWTTNGSAPARNLRKSDLGAVIFGCKNSTIKECHSKMLFGLPAPHFAYVRNIRPSLPLFLFNYSDRNLHGIYEAISPGLMNIDQYGWSNDSTDHTPYGAQVRVKVQTQCSPLSEDEFKPVIAGNYYESKLFWFELDRAQTTRLTSMFTSRASVSRPLNMATGKTAFSTWNRGQSINNVGVQIPRNFLAPLDNAGLRLGGSWAALSWGETKNNGIHSSSGRSYAAIVSGMDTSDPEKKSNPASQRKWTSLFKSSSTGTTTMKDEGVSSSDVCLQSGELELFKADNSDWASGKYAAEKEHFEADNSDWGIGKYDVEKKHFEADKSGWGSGNFSAGCEVEALDTLCEAPTSGEEGQYDNSVLWLDDDADMTLPDCSIPYEAPTGSLVIPQPDEDGQAKSFADKTYDKTSPTDINTECSYATTSVEMDCTDNHEEECAFISEMAAQVQRVNECSLEMVTTEEMESPELQALLVKLMEEVEAMKVSQQSLQCELFESKAEVKLLRTHYQKLESTLPPTTKDVEEAMFDSFNEPHPVIDKSILIIGGFNGSSWLPDICSYLPNKDRFTCLAPMSIVRKYSSAIAVNGEVFVLGGSDGDTWQNTVESYNSFTDEWSGRPTLNQKKGSLAGASLHDNIFAIGGGDGKECFSNVEMLDLNIGKWIPTRSMLHKRFAPAAAELNGAIYVVGGYDGQSYLSSAERFDPREHSWTSLRNMGTKRGCHSLTVLNDKLYALGGFDGANMVSSVEIFDPRVGSWTMGESMNSPRGYCGATVLGDKIYIIGGTTEKDEILDTIELYEEGGGWDVYGSKAVGKRCFISAIVV